jgi:putative membrane protein
MRLLLIWLINAVALLAVPHVVPGIAVDSFASALIAALLLGLVNTILRPLLVLLTLPVTILAGFGVRTGLSCPRTSRGGAWRLAV